MTLKQQILDYIVTNDHVTFQELMRIPGVWDNGSPDGMALHHPEFDRILLWSDITQEAATAFQELKKENLAHWLPCSMMPYIIDGGGLNLPRAKGPRHYKRLHWLPVVWRPGPTPETLLKAYDARQRRAKG